MVRQIVERRGGMISVGQDGGAVLTAMLPAILQAGSEAAVPQPRGMS
jgi:hypothetical protein